MAKQNGNVKWIFLAALMLIAGALMLDIELRREIPRSDYVTVLGAANACVGDGCAHYVAALGDGFVNHYEYWWLTFNRDAGQVSSDRPKWDLVALMAQDPRFR